MCMVIFELLPDKAKRALKVSHWWADLVMAKNSAEYPFVDIYPAPQP